MNHILQFHKLLLRALSSECLQCVELGPVECIRLDCVEAVSNQVPVKGTVLLILCLLSKALITEVRQLNI